LKNEGWRKPFLSCAITGLQLTQTAFLARRSFNEHARTITSVIPQYMQRVERTNHKKIFWQLENVRDWLKQICLWWRQTFSWSFFSDFNKSLSTVVESSDFCRNFCGKKNVAPP